MKRNFLKRVLVMTLTWCMILTMIPLHFSVNDVEAVSGINNLTCANFISNSTARSYIDTMMRYYINNNSSLRTTLDNGLAVVFLFEGGSDNYWGGSTYANNAYNIRNQGVCIVVKKNSSGNAYIDFYCENSCSIPGEPTWCTGAAYSGSTTLMDGIYSFHTTNHTGPYAALQVNLSASNGNCYYTPPGSLNGYQNGASGINIHTRSSNIAGGSSLGWVWSAGCQLIGTGNGTDNQFNGFMKSVCNISWNPWINYSSKTFNTWSSANCWVNKGYYVVDRQLGLTNPSGTKYGSGSLINLYNTTALTNITAKSTAAMKAAGADKVDYLSQCTYYPSYGKVKITGTDVWTRTLPCYASVDSSTVAISSYNSGDELTVTGLYKNTEGEYWYRTKSASGADVYFNGAYVDFVSKITSDIKMTDHTPPNGHLQGTGYVIDGNISSQYNRITNVSGYVYEGFGTSGSNITGTSVSVSTTSYKLAGSDVDSAIWMSVPANGPHTLQLSVKYINYYVTGGTTLKSSTGTKVLATDYFMVIPSSVSQSSCSHNYQNYVVKAATCTSNGESVKACPTCGYISGKVTVTGEHTYGDWVVTEATCTNEGSRVKTCTRCGDKVTEVTSLGGHSYITEIIPGTCIDLEKTKYTCSLCGDTYTDYTDPRANWSEERPSDVENEIFIESKTQYRYADYSSKTSYESSLDGYTLEKSEWEQDQTGTVDYVKSWPAGFSTSHLHYTAFNRTPKTSSTTASEKTVINSDKVIGYVYYHWCYADSYYSSSTQTGDFNTFHAYYSTTAPSNYQYDTTDMSYKTSHSGCSNTEWYYPIEVNRQTYTTYRILYTYGKWSDWSDWSDEPCTASDTLKVETRTLYRYVDESKYGSHVYENGICKVCNRAEPEYYLFGYINGANYACEEDADNIGIYKFEAGKLTVEFTENSYVAFKTGDNKDWFMTDGYPGEGTTTALFYNTRKGINAEKMFVPKGVEVEFTLTNNNDGSFTLSYSLDNCKHLNHNTSGQCTACGIKVDHDYADGVCSVCGKASPVYYLAGFINGSDYYGSEFRFVDGTLTAEFAEDSYVFVRTADNSVWYMTDGYQGDEATSATLYDAATLDSRGDKLFVPKGKSVEFTLVDNKDGTFAFSYTTNVCKHLRHNADGFCLSCNELVEHSFSQGFCTVCGKDCDHNYGEDNICSVCQKVKPGLCLFGFINGADYNGTEYKFDENGELRIKFTDATYVAVKTDDDQNWYMTDTYQGDNAISAILYNTKILEGRGDKLFVPRGRWITFTIKENPDDTYTFSFTAEACEHDVHNINGICLSCGELVDHELVNGDCVICGNNCKHNWEDGICTKCQRTQPQYYLFGYINGQDYFGDDYRFEDGKLVVKFSTDAYIAVKSDDMVEYKTDGYLGEETTTAVLYNTTLLGESADKLYIPANREVIIMLVDNGNNTITLSYRVTPCKHTSHNTDGVCTVCSQTVSHEFDHGYCTVCYAECEHNYENGRCTICNMIEPDYYLFGFINGADYACDSDADNIGIYKFTQGKLTVVFTQDSFVAVKTGDNMNWFMTDGFDSGTTSAVLYNTKAGINADKLFVPRGRVVTFTLVNNGDGTYTLSYTAAPCEHAIHNTDGICITCGESVSHEFENGVCVDCSAVCKHDWQDDTCSVCGLICQHNWIDGECCICAKACEHSYKSGKCTICDYNCVHKFSGGECTVCGISCEHNWISGKCYICADYCAHNFKDAICTICSYACKHNYVGGTCTLCSTVCGHKWSHGNCIVCDVICRHEKWENGICSLCSEKCEHTWSQGKCEICSMACAHNWHDGVCTICSDKCSHTWVNSNCVICKSDCKHSYDNGTCTVCKKSTDFYLIGQINGSETGYGSDYLNKGNNLFTDGTLTMSFTADSYVFVKSADNKDWYMAENKASGKSVYLHNTKTGSVSEMLFIPAGVKATFTLTPMADDSFKLSYTIDSCSHTKHDTLGKCIGCRADVDHSYTAGYCSVCSVKQPGKEMYLFGTINGADYGYNNDAMTIGSYKFTNGRLTATFTQDSYVAIKSFDNKDWYMADTAEGTSAVMYNTRTGKGSELLFVPGGKEVSFKLTENADGTYTLSYETTGAEESAIIPKYTTVTFEDGIRYQTIFHTANLDDVSPEDMGLLIFVGDDAKFTSAQMLYGSQYKDGYFVVSTDAIHPKALGDTVYFRIYAKRSDGTYVYSELMSFSAEKYAYSVLQNKHSSKEEKALMVTLLNFGAEYQLYFGYNTDKLINSALTAEQKALVVDYSPELTDKVIPADSNKQGEFVKNSTGFMIYPTANFSDSEFTVSYNMNTKLPVKGNVKLYYWTADTYNSVSSLAKYNATGVLTMTMTDTGAYVADVTSIGINELDDTIYAAVVFESEGTVYCSGVVAYSMAEYCKVNAQNSSSSVQNLAQATIVFGYYADKYSAQS